jgi:nitrate reductase gamma subunit
MANYAFIIFVVIVEGFHLSIEKKYISKKFSKKYLLIPAFEDGGAHAFFASITGCIKYIYGYTFHVSFPTLIGNLKNLNETNSKKVHNISFGIIAGAYFIIGFFGYLMKENVSTVIFREYEDSNQRDYFTITIKVVLSVFLLSLIPNRYIPLRDGYTSLIGKKKLTYKKDLLITTLALIFSNALVFMNEELFVEEGTIKIDIFNYMVNIFGGLFGVIICFGLPVINYTAVNGNRKAKSLIGYEITAFFLVIGLFSFAYSLYEMFGGKKNDE